MTATSIRGLRRVAEAADEKALRFLHVTASMSPEWGGPVVGVQGLTSALIRRGISCEIAAPIGRRVGTDVAAIPGVPVHPFDTGFLARFWTAYSTTLSAFVDEQLATGNFDLVYIHETWHYGSYAAARAAIRHGVPYIQVFHGALDPWRTRRKRFRKIVYAWAVQKRLANSAAALHVLTQNEKAQVAERGFTAPSFVIPNGIDSDRTDAVPDTSDFLGRYPRLNGKRVILFLGRLHPMKGLDILARGFSIVASGIEDAVLLVAGPDEDGTRSAIEAILRESGVLDRVVFTGLLTGNDKAAVLACADIFVLPSHSEGFSHAVLEALAAGLPVVISEQCHFSEVAEHDAGFVVKTSAASVADAIGALLSDDELRVRMGRNGRELVTARYTWDAIAQSVIDMVHNILREV